MPRRSRRLNPPCLLDGLSDDLVLRLFSRAPFMAHGTLHVVCRRLKTLLRSRAFLTQRVDSGLAEHSLIVAGGVHTANSTASAECFAFCGRWWCPIAPLSTPRFGPCSAMMENEDGLPEMWVLGGFDGLPLATVEAYNPRMNTWRSCLPLSQRRIDAVAGVIGGQLVVAGGDHHDGGDDGATPSSSVEAYTSTGWISLPPLPHAAWQAAACALNGQLYVMGGYESNKVQVLESSEQNGFTWTVKNDLPAMRRGAGSAVMDGKVWLLGGLLENDEGDEAETASVLIYDAPSDSWATGPALPRAINRCSAANVGGEIFVTGQYSIPTPDVNTPDEIDWEEHQCTYVYRDATWAELAVTGGPLLEYTAPAVELALLG